MVLFMSSLQFKEKPECLSHLNTNDIYSKSFNAAEEIIEESSIGTVTRCFVNIEGDLKKCVLNVSSEIDLFVTKQSQQ